MAGKDEIHDEYVNIPPPVPPIQQAPHTLSTIKLLILKKGEYDIWAMKMEHYLEHTDYPIWEVIQKGNGHVQVSTDTNEQIRVLPPKTVEEVLAREREKKARTTLLMSIPEDHLAKFHKITDAKEMWEAIKSIFGVSTEDANQKFLRSLPASLSQVSFIMRTKPRVDSLSFDDLYNNLRVFESDVKGSTGSSSNAQNVAFISSSTSSTNDVSISYGDSTSSGHNSQKEGSSSYTDELMYSFFANQSSGLQLDHEDLEQKTGRKLQFDTKEPVSFDKTKEEPKALVTLDGDDVDWTGHAEEEQENFALMAFSNSGLDTEVKTCSKECEQSYAKLKKLYDEQREQLGDASIEIQAYTQALKKMSAKDKFRLGYGDKINESVLSYENEVLESVFNSRFDDVEDSPVNDRFAKDKGMHAVPTPMTGIYMPPKSDFGIDESKFTYETLESVPKPAVNEPKPVVNEPKVVSETKVWSEAPIIEEFKSDSDDENIIKPSKEQEKPSFAFINTVKHVKTPRKTVKEQNTCSPNPKADKRDWNGLMSKRLGLGYGFTRKACFVYGSFGHLIRDCDFHEKRMAKQVELNKIKVNTARQNFSSQAAATSTARKVNTARPIVNDIRLRNNFYKSHSPIRRPLNRTTAPKVNFTNHKVNTTGDKIVSAIGGNRETVVKASAYYETVHKELGNRMKRGVTTVSSFEAEQDNGKETTSASTNQDEEMEITTIIDGRHTTVTEASLRRHLKLKDSAGINSLPSAEIFEQLVLMGVDTALFPIMLVQGQTLQGAAALLTSQTPSTTPITTPKTHQSPHSSPTMPTPQEAEEPATMPYDSPLPRAHTLRSDEGNITFSEMTVKKLEQTVKSTQAKRKTRIVILEDEEGQEDPSNQGRSLIEEFDLDAVISFPFNDAEVPEQTSGDTEILLQEEDLLSFNAAPVVSTVVRQVYIRRSLQKRKDKGKAIMQEDEPIQKKSKKQIAKQLQEDINKARQEQERQEVVTQAVLTHVIDWSDHAVIRYHALHNRPRSVAKVRKNMCIYLCNQGGYKMRHLEGMSYDDIRPIFEKVWDQIHSFVFVDSELEILKLKRVESIKKPSTKEEKKKDDSSKPAKSRRKKTLARKRASGKDSEDSMKRQKLEDDTEKEDLQEYLTIVPLEEMNVEALLIKYPLIDWEINTEESRVYWKIIRVGDHTEMYQFFDDMLKNFDREDLVNLWKFVKDRFSSTQPIDDKDKALWVELKRIFKPDTDDLLEL
ncbi:hypothetical protein Tco_1354260 [Tanacetum coccineum]